MELKSMTNDEFKTTAKKLGICFTNMINYQLAEVLLMKERVQILNMSGYNVEDYYTKLFNGESAEDAFKGFNDVWESLNNVEPNEPTIEQLKKQIKYSKNPLEVKRLNMKLNQIYKERKKKYVESI